MTNPLLTVLIGGATGFVGREIVPYLSQNYPNINIRVLTRDPNSELAHRFANFPNVTVLQGDYNNMESLQSAARGVDRAYVACNNVALQYQFECNFINACKEQGVKRIIKLAMPKYLCYKDAPGHGATHYRVIEHLKNIGIPYVAICTSYFFQTLLHFTHFIKTQGILPQLFGDSKQNMIDCRDLAQYIVALLTCNEEVFNRLSGQLVEICSPEKLGGEDWASALRKQGVKVEYKKVTPEEGKQIFLDLGVPEDMVNNIIAVHTTFYDGSIPIPSQYTTTALENIPGVPKQFRTFNDFIKEISPMLKNTN